MTQNYHTPITFGAPANSSIVNSPLGALDEAITNLLTAQEAFTAQRFAVPTILTISVAGEITPTQTLHKVAANTGTSDNLDTITMNEGWQVVLTADTGDTITVRHGVGNIKTFSGDDITLTADNSIVCWRLGTTVFVIGGGGAVFTGDSGSGGVEGLVPAPAAGDAALKKLLGADGTWNFPPSRILFSATAQKDIDNTASETTLFGSGVGSLSIPANTLAIGSMVRIVLTGYQDSAAAAGNVQVRFKLGGATILDTTAKANSNSLADRWTRIEAVFTWRTIGATGTYDGQGFLQWTSAAGVTSTYDAVNATGALTIDTTAAIAVDVTWQYGTANPANEIHITNACIELIR